MQYTVCTHNIGFCANVHVLSHFDGDCARPKSSEKTKSDLLPESREQSGVGGVGREKERGGAVAWGEGGRPTWKGDT